MAGRDEGLQHPHADVLAGAAAQLGWPENRIQPALEYLKFRDSPERLARPRDRAGELLARNTRATLVAIALKLKAAVVN